MKFVTVALTLLVASVLTACAAQPAATPSTSASVTPSETAVAEPQVAQIVVGAAQLTMLNDDGSTFASFGYFDDASEIIGTLTGVLGEPTVAPYTSQGLEDPSGTDTSWGGFTVRLRDFTPTAPDNTNLSYVVSDSTVGDVDVTSTPGVAVGAPVSALAAYTSTGTWTQDGSTFAWYIVDENVIGTDMSDYVMAKLNVDEGVVVGLLALGHNYGV